MTMLTNVLLDLLVTLTGIFVGTLAAMAVNRANERQRKQQRAQIILRAVAQELAETHQTLQEVRPAYVQTAWGKSFYVSTSAWDTALASGDLPDIIGFELADAIAAQYSTLVRLRYYVSLMTQLWFAPTSIDGYELIRDGFRQVIVDAITKAVNNYAAVRHLIDEHQPAGR